MIGIALEKGYLEGVNQNIMSFFPEYKSEHPWSQINDVSIKHLLTMSSGIDCYEGATNGFFKSDNWIKFFLEQPSKTILGRAFNYSSPSSHVLSGIVVKATGYRTEDFAKKYLFDPLGILKYEWPADAQNINHGGFGLKLAPNSITKLGQLYLNKGCWKGEQILSSKYILGATRKHTSGGFPEKDGYGYQWWVSEKEGISYYYAAGLGGQYLFIIPEANTIVTITSNSRRPHIENKRIFIDYFLRLERK